MNRQVALITGASRGIGFGIAKALAQRGFHLAINATKVTPALDKAIAELQSYGVKVMPCIFDIADTAEHQPHVMKVQQVLGSLTTLVNNAGVSVLARGDLLDVSEQSYDRCFRVNARGMFFLSQAFARQLINNRVMTGKVGVTGDTSDSTSNKQQQHFYSIINVTSANARAVAVNRGEYCASKAAAAMISQTFAVRLGKEGIAVYDVQPGLIDTDMTAGVIQSYQQRVEQGLTIFPKTGTPQEIGTLVATLASGGLPYTTGQVISADGGLLVPRF